MLNAIQQNPITSIAVVMTAVIPIVWRTLYALYVKPRDFRITMLEKHVEELRGEVLKPMAQSLQPVTREAVSAVVPSFTQTPAAPPVPPDPLRSLKEMHRAWKTEGQTELQRKHFEERYVGQEVSWHVFIDSIDKTKYFISMYADAAPNRGLDDCRVCAHFPLTEETRLLEFKPGERVRLTGNIREFFLFPVLEPAKIEKA